MPVPATGFCCEMSSTGGQPVKLVSKTGVLAAVTIVVQTSMVRR